MQDISNLIFTEQKTSDQIKEGTTAKQKYIVAELYLHEGEYATALLKARESLEHYRNACDVDNYRKVARHITDKFVKPILDKVDSEIAEGDPRRTSLTYSKYLNLLKGK